MLCPACRGDLEFIEEGEDTMDNETKMIYACNDNDDCDVSFVDIFLTKKGG